MKIAVSALLAGFLFFSCSKNDNDSETESPSVITITKPLTTGIFVEGSPLKVEGEMSDNNVLSSAKLEIKNKGTGAVLHTVTTNTGNVGFYRFDWTWTVNGITGPTTGTVKVTAKDKLGNEVSKEVDVTLNN